jgi:hypothetical protein
MTSPTTNGVPDSEPPWADEERLDRLLREAERQAGLGEMARDYSADCSRYLYPTSESIRRMSDEELAEAALLLSGLAVHAARTLNRERAKYAWAEARLKKGLATVVADAPGYAYDERLRRAAAGCEVAQKCLRLMALTKARADALDYLPVRLERLAADYQALRLSRRKAT